MAFFFSHVRRLKNLQHDLRRVFAEQKLAKRTPRAADHQGPLLTCRTHREGKKKQKDFSPEKLSDRQIDGQTDRGRESGTERPTTDAGVRLVHLRGAYVSTASSFFVEIDRSPTSFRSEAQMAWAGTRGLWKSSSGGEELPPMREAASGRRRRTR